MDKATETQREKEAKPRYREKGPIRTEAVVPFLIVVCLIWLYFFLFFDGHLRRAMEWTATRANGAEVDVGYVRTSFFRASLVVGGIEVTDPAQPDTNRFQIGRMELKFLWDGLLRAKFIVDRAGILGIEIGAPRRNPGFVLPASSGTSGMLAGTREKLTQVALGEVERILGGIDPAKNLQELTGLKSAARVNELRELLKKKEGEWKGKLDAIPGSRDIEGLKTRLDAIGTGAVTGPADAVNRAGQLKTLIQEVDAKAAALRNAGDSLMADVNGFSGSLAEIDELVQADRAELAKKLKIPRIDAKGIAEQLFGRLLLSRIAEVERYVNLARKYIPPKTAGTEARRTPKTERARGLDYAFGRPSGYPKFWIKKAEISSSGKHSVLAGASVRGEILDLTNDQGAVGKPTVARLQADFPETGVRNLEAVLTIDHRGEAPEEIFQASVGAYPVKKMVLSASDSLSFGFAGATGSAALKADVKGDNILLSLNGAFKDINYEISARSKLLESIIQGAAKEFNLVSLEADMKGSWNNPEISVRSNLAEGLEKGLARQLQGRIAEATQKIEALVREQIAGPKAALLDSYRGDKTKYLGGIEASAKSLDALKEQAKGKLAALTGAGGSGVMDRLKKLPF